MKTCNLSLATVVLGALAVSYSACSAQGQDNTYPGGPTFHSGDSTSSAGSAEVPPPGSAGTPVHAGGGTPAASGGATGFPSSGGALGRGGPTTGRGGTSAGRGGAQGAVGGAATGSAGTPPVTTTGCPAAAGTITDLLIDDLEDGDDAIRPIGSRVGYWYTYNDGTLGAVQVPAPNATFKGVTPGHIP